MSGEINELKRQVADLQSQLAFHEDAVRSLDDALSRQQQEIMLLQRQLELMRQRQQELASQQTEGAEHASADEKPPHY